MHVRVRFREMCFWGLYFGLLLLVIAYFSPKFALGIVLALFQRDSAMGFWMAMGYPKTTAFVTVAIISGTSVIFLWRHLNDFYHRKLDEKFINYPSKYALLYYTFPLVLSLIPWAGCVLSILVIRPLKLNKWVSLALILMGSTIDTFLMGTLFSILDPVTRLTASALILVVGIYLTVVVWKKQQQSDSILSAE